MSSTLRPTLPRDWPRIREICCLTGNAGDPIDATRWPFFGELWTAPYRKLLSDWTWVVETDGQVAGYLTGCPDTRSLTRRRRWTFTFPLLLQVAAGKFTRNSDTRRFIRRSLGLDRAPEETFPAEVLRQINVEYPAHLHINLDSKHRSSGNGKRLMEIFEKRLSAQKIGGVHLYCGPKPLGFYLRQGYQELGRIEFRPGIWVYALGKRIAATIPQS